MTHNPEDTEEHYILIRVRQPREQMGTQTVGMIRRLIHDFAMEHDLAVADNAIRSDRRHFPWGAPVPFEEARKLFEAITPSEDHKAHFRAIAEEQDKNRQARQRIVRSAEKKNS